MLYPDNYVFCSFLSGQCTQFKFACPLAEQNRMTPALGTRRLNRGCRLPDSGDGHLLGPVRTMARARSQVAGRESGVSTKMAVTVWSPASKRVQSRSRWTQSTVGGADKPSQPRSGRSGWVARGRNRLLRGGISVIGNPAHTAQAALSRRVGKPGRREACCCRVEVVEGGTGSRGRGWRPSRITWETPSLTRRASS